MTFREDLSVDFGGLVRRVPAEVVAPTTVDELAAAIARQDRPWTLRGAGHSARGETLTDGTVIDMRRLTGVVADGADEITVRGGTQWLDVWAHLAPRARRPLTLTTHLRVTVGGTLAMGGVGDASHLYGLQANTVRRALLITPDGARHDVAAGDPLLAHALCGHGQLGAFAEVTLATRAAPVTITGRVYRWAALDAMVEDVARLEHDYVRPRVVWTEGIVRAWALVCDSHARDLPAPRYAVAQTPLETIDLFAHSQFDPAPQWVEHNPVLELVLPYPAGLPALRRIDTALANGPLLRWLPRGSSLQIVRGSDLPLTPFRAEQNMVFVLRPEPPTLDDALACEPPLRALADEAYAAGGAIYLSSFAPAREQLAAQLGPGAASLADYKRALDPSSLCNRGSLHGW